MFRHTLPFQTSALIGRAREVALAQDFLRRSTVRLLTLTGPGGVGKTRLALAVAAGMQTDFMDGVAFVSLAPLGDASLVVSTIAQVVGIQEVGRQPLLEQLQTYLRDRQLLLVLDNFEHLLAAAPLVTELLAMCPRLKVLVTSRAVLHLQGEHEFAVPPLALPDLQYLPDIAGLGQCDAVALFVARAQAVKPDFHLSDVTARAVAEICVRLDGLPLALELAATRIKVLPPRALLARLHLGGAHRLEILAGGGRDLPARQQTLRRTLAWSYALLDTSTQQLLRGLSVFIAGCTLDAVEAVTRGALASAPGSGYARSLTTILDGLQSLLDNSLLYQIEQADGEPRFMVLETIREYALEQLERSDEAPIVRRVHATYYLHFAEAVEPTLTTAEQEIGLLRLEVEQDNLRAALRWGLHGLPHPVNGQPGAPEHAQLGLRLAGAIWRFWLMRGNLSEGRRWLEAALEQAQGQRDIFVGKALHGAGVLALYQGDPSRAASLCGESLAVYRQLGDKRGSASALDGLANVAMRGGNLAAARAMYAECVSLMRELGDRWGLAHALIYQGLATLQQGALPAARPLIEEALFLCRTLGDRQGTGHALQALGWVAYMLDDATIARDMWEESLAICRELRDRRGIARTLHGLGTVTLKQGDYERSSGCLEEALALLIETGDKWFIGACLTCMACLAAVEGRPEHAAQIFGAVDALNESISSAPPPFIRTIYEPHLAATRATLGAVAFRAAWTAGRVMTLEQVLVTLRQAPAKPESTLPRVAAYPAGLTAREVEVLRLVAQGLTNAQIAGRLIISQRTVNGHLNSIYGKLGFHSRVEAARFAVEQRLV